MNEDYHPVGRPSGESGAMIIDRAELRKRAEAASGGEWKTCSIHDATHGARFFVQCPEEPEVPDSDWMDVCQTSNWQKEANAAYIVASQPSTVLALLDCIEELEGALAPFAAGSIDVSGSAVILGYPLAKGALDVARKALSGEKQ